MPIDVNFFSLSLHSAPVPARGDKNYFCVLLFYDLIGRFSVVPLRQPSRERCINVSVKHNNTPFPPLSSSSPQPHHYATSTILDDEPVWARADTIDPRQRSPPPHGYQPPSVRGATPQQMTVVHSSAKPVPDSDIYRYFNRRLS